MNDNATGSAATDNEPNNSAHNNPRTASARISWRRRGDHVDMVARLSLGQPQSTEQIALMAQMVIDEVAGIEVALWEQGGARFVPTKGNATPEKMEKILFIIAGLLDYELAEVQIEEVPTPSLHRLDALWDLLELAYLLEQAAQARPRPPYKGFMTGSYSTLYRFGRPGGFGSPFKGFGFVEFDDPTPWA